MTRRLTLNRRFFMGATLGAAPILFPVLAAAKQRLRSWARSFKPPHSEFCRRMSATRLRASKRRWIKRPVPG
jgi:hypothetical protein